MEENMTENRGGGTCRYFKSRAWNLFLVAAILFGYNQVLEKKELEASLEASEEQLAHTKELILQASEAAGSSENGEGEGYQDGSYEGTGQGFGGEIRVKATIEEEKIVQVEIISAPGEDDTYLKTAKKVLDTIKEAQTAEVEAVSGATFSSSGIIEATKDALGKAAK